MLDIFFQLPQSSSQTPLWLTILSSGIVVAVLGALFTHWSTIRLKKIEFDYDYKRYILDKRKTAYNVFEMLLPKIFEHYRYKPSNGDGNTVYGFFYSEPTQQFHNPIPKYLNLLAQTEESSFWLSENLMRLVLELNDYLINQNESFNFTSIPALIVHAESQRKYLNNLRKRVYEQYFNDLKTLDDIHKFKRAVLGVVISENYK